MLQTRVARDGEEFPICYDNGDWITNWQPPGTAPDGTPVGVNGLCVTADAQIVLISKDGALWRWPGGHREHGESWEEALRREVLEEACSTVRSARLLGFCHSVCISGPEKGTKLLHSLWRAEIELMPWQPQFEITHRKLVPAAEVLSHLWMENGLEPIYRRAVAEARLV